MLKQLLISNCKQLCGKGEKGSDGAELSDKPYEKTILSPCKGRDQSMYYMNPDTFSVQYESQRNKGESYPVSVCTTEWFYAYAHTVYQTHFHRASVNVFIVMPTPLNCPGTSHVHWNCFPTNLLKHVLLWIFWLGWTKLNLYLNTICYMHVCV